MLSDRTLQMLDLCAPEHGIEVEYRDNTLWINVDGICRLRIGQIACPLVFEHTGLDEQRIEFNGRGEVSG